MSVRRTLLIVDDMEINRTVLCEIFRGEYEILEAADGQEAIQILEERYCQLAAVLLDVIMPVKDGIEVLRYIRKRAYMSQIPVFIITADSSAETMRSCYELGVMDFIGKPYLPYFVHRRVNSVVELYQAREQLAGVVDMQKEALAEKSMEIQQLDDSIIETLATAIEFRDLESGAHVHRIRDLTELLLMDLRNEGFQEYNLTDEKIQQIATAAIMHDVGKIAIADNILNKPGRLTTDEFEVMKTHTVRGCEILDRIPKSKENPIYQYAYDICRHHHEKWDGGGYPDGLSGSQISLWSQVVSLADCYDALVSKRVYKSAYTHQEAIKMILGGECGQFNPGLLNSFHKLEGRISQAYRVQ